MTEPIVFIGTHGIKEGRREEFKAVYRENTETIRAGKPGTVAFLGYLNEDGTEVSTVHVFPDAAAMEEHLLGADERVKRAAEFLEFRRLEVWGKPTEKALQILRMVARGGVTLEVHPLFLSGYLRLAAEPA